MKRMNVKVRRAMSMMLAVVMLICMQPLSVEAKYYDERGTFQFIVPAESWSGPIHAAYDNREDANENVCTLYVQEESLPIKVTINGSDDDNTETFTIDEYGTYYLKVKDVTLGRAVGDMLLFVSIIGMVGVLREEPYCFATVTVAPPEQNPENMKTEEQIQTAARQLTEEESLDQRWKELIRKVGFPFAYRESSEYAVELKAFMTGEWDGSRRSDESDGWSSYRATRYVMHRTYYWIATDYITGEAYSLSANVDYNGYKEVISGSTNAQKYSLAVSYIDGVIEQWSSYEQKDAWEIAEVAEGLEKIEQIVPLATEGSSEEDIAVYVSTLDGEGNQHMYLLFPGGRVLKKM